MSSNAFVGQFKTKIGLQPTKVPTTFLNVQNLGKFDHDSAHNDVQHAYATNVRDSSASDPFDRCSGVYPCQSRFQEFYLQHATGTVVVA